jgi:hypothetical protein
MLEGRHQHATIDQAVIDNLRKRSGRKGSVGYDQRLSLENATQSESATHLFFCSSHSGHDVETREDVSRYLRFVSDSIDRGCYVLYHAWGLNAGEIGDIFGFSESRVCQRLERVQSSLSKRIAAQKRARVQGKTSGEMAGVLSEETIRNGWGLGERESYDLAQIKSFGMATLNEKSF